MSGTAYTWKVIGRHCCVADEDGRVIGYTVSGAATAEIVPIQAYCGEKRLGLYIDDKSARQAVMRALEARRPDEE